MIWYINELVNQGEYESAREMCDESFYLRDNCKSVIISGMIYNNETITAELCSGMAEEESNMPFWTFLVRDNDKNQYGSLVFLKKKCFENIS